MQGIFGRTFLPLIRAICVSPPGRAISFEGFNAVHYSYGGLDDEPPLRFDITYTKSDRRPSLEITDGGGTMSSTAAIVAGVVIYFSGWYLADTIVSLLIIGLILFSSTRLLLEAFHILMEGAPRGLSLKALTRELRAIDGVSDVHELHAWSLSSGFNALSAHLVVKDPAKQQAALKTAACCVAQAFGIRHSVFQVEAEPVENSSCDTCAQQPLP